MGVKLNGSLYFKPEGGEATKTIYTWNDVYSLMEENQRLREKVKTTQENCDNWEKQWNKLFDEFTAERRRVIELEAQQTTLGRICIYLHDQIFAIPEGAPTGDLLGVEVPIRLITESQGKCLGVTLIKDNNFLLVSVLKEDDEPEEPVSD